MHSFVDACARFSEHPDISLFWNVLYGTYVHVYIHKHLSFATFQTFETYIFRRMLYVMCDVWFVGHLSERYYYDEVSMVARLKHLLITMTTLDTSPPHLVISHTSHPLPLSLSLSHIIWLCYYYITYALTREMIWILCIYIYTSTDRFKRICFMLGSI